MTFNIFELYLINIMALFALIPILYIATILGLLYLFFRILDGIRKSNHERNDILRGIHDELKRQNEISNNIKSGH